MDEATTAGAAAGGGVGSPWYMDGRFSTFWEQYNKLMLTSHQQAVTRAGLVATQTHASSLNVIKHQRNPPSHTPRSQHQHRRRNRTRKHDRSRSKKRQRLRERSGRHEAQSDTECLYSKMKQGMHIQDANDVDMDEDFLNFLEQSKRHREEWKVAKKRDSAQEANVHNEKVKEHPDVIRNREMHHLYGKSAPKIQAMETALQLSFERNATLHRPQHWPNIPLNIMFS